MKQYKNDHADDIDKLLYKYFEENKEIPAETVKIINSAPHKRKKIKYNLFKVAIFILTISIITTGTVFSKEITNFFKELFGLNNIGIDNTSIVNAIEEKDYIQNCNMDYYKINEKYSVKIDYLMLDDINLYTVFNLQSNEEIANDYRISIPDLEIIADDETIYNASTGENYSIYISSGWNKVKQEDIRQKRELLFLISDGLPRIRKLEYKFSKIILYKNNSPAEKQIEINCENEIILKVDIEEKFINRDILEFDTEKLDNKYKIDKLMSNSTGTYLIFETTKPEINIELIYNNKVYVGNKIILAIEGDKYIFIIQYIHCVEIII